MTKMCEEKKTIYNYYSCNICSEPSSGHLPIFGHPHRWVYHFIIRHSEKYKKSFECHSEKCGYKNMNYKQAIIHYRKEHIVLNSRCSKCYRVFDSLQSGKLHKAEGCGSYMRCGSCSTTIFGKSRIKFHKTGGCMNAFDGCGLPDSDSDNEEHSEIED